MKYCTFLIRCKLGGIDFASEPDVDALAQQLGWKAEFLEEDGGLEHIPKANIYQSGWVNELGSSPPCFFLWGALCVSLYHCIRLLLC